MRDERILFIGGWQLLHGFNHRPKRMLAYLQRRFKHLDSVGFDNFYSGSGPPTAPPWHKARKGISDLLHRRVRISGRGSSRQIVIHDLFAPPPMHLLVKDLWRYLILRQVISKPYDLAIFGDPENAWLASLLKRSGRVEKLIYDDWDYHPGWESNRLCRKLMENRERLCVRQADAVFTINALLAQLRIQQGARQVVVIPNGVELTLFAQSREKVSHPPTLIYMGSLSPLWGIDIAVKAMPAIMKSVPDIRFLIAGAGPAEAYLRELSEELDMAERVKFLGQLKHQALPTVLAEVDIGLATSLHNSEFRKYASPLKLIEYMAAGLPVIATRVGQTEIMMQQSDAGLLIDHTVQEFVMAVIKLLTNKTLYDRCSQAAITYAGHFDWDLLLDQAYQYLVYILESNNVTSAAVSSSELPKATS